MKKGFTLVEMLIVVTVLVTLMGITFRLSGIGDSSSKRSKTIARLQRLENCLSGYYAAFGTYPPVKLHGSRNYKLAVSSHGIQNVDGEEEDLKWDGSDADWEKVKAACKSQPVGCYFPYAEGFSVMIKLMSDELQEKSSSMNENKRKIFSQGFDDGVSNNLGRHSKNKGESDWRECQLFKFGLMSYLLPRYLVMMNSNREVYTYSQWTVNNFLPANPMTGEKYRNWDDIRDYVVDDDVGERKKYVENISSQAICARWMANLAGCCEINRRNKVFFGVNIRDEDADTLSTGNDNIEVYSPGGYDDDSTSGQYILDRVTIKDGWGEEFFYYSSPPYQNYVLWSAGPNKRTFPPWVSREKLDSKANELIGKWIEDDIVGMSN